MLKIADHIAATDPIKKGSNTYKTSRSDQQLSAVQVFAFTTSAEEDQYFTQQANLLAETVRHYRANVPTVLGWGFTQTGNFPFIESEWIEGYDLHELVNSDTNISVNGLGILAEQVSRVLTLCHNAGVVHSEISQKHIRWDENKGRFVLTNFGFGLQTTGPGPYTLAVMANNQDEVALKQKDIHDLGVVLQELLEQHLLPERPGGLGDLKVSLVDKQLKDGSVMPAWLATCIERAISDKEARFKDAHEMYNYIILHHKTPFETNRWFRSKPQRPLTIPLNRTTITTRPSRKKLQSMVATGVRTGRKNMRFVFDRRVALGLLIAAILFGFSIIAQNRQNGKTALASRDSSVNRQVVDTTTSSLAEMNNKNDVGAAAEQKKQTLKKKTAVQKQVVVEQPSSVDAANQQDLSDTDLGAYKVRSKAYFHSGPSERTRRRGFIVHWNNSVLHPLKEQNDFVYVVYTNDKGQTSKGWLRKKDLVKQ
jgi:serine/threonine-protein kinase